MCSAGSEVWGNGITKIDKGMLVVLFFGNIYDEDRNAGIDEEVKTMSAMIKVKGEQISEKEQQAYVEYLESKYNRKLKSLEVKIDGDYADLTYEWEPVPFERIRRITGYLVGTMDNWNDAKTAEEADRVKHDVSSGLERL